MLFYGHCNSQPKMHPYPPLIWKQNHFSALLRLTGLAHHYASPLQFHCFPILQSMQLYLDQRVSWPTTFPCAVLYSQICSQLKGCLMSRIIFLSNRFGSEDACGSFVMPRPTLFCLGLRCVPFMWGHFLPTHWRIVKHWEYRLSTFFEAINLWYLSIKSWRLLIRELAHKFH